MQRFLRTFLSVVVALAIAAAVAYAARPAAGTYTGKTSQQKKVTLKVHRGGKRVDFRVHFAKETQCSGQSTYVTANTDLGKNVPVKKDGTFTFTFADRQPVTINGQTGASDHYSYTVTGKFKGKRATGTLKHRDDIYDAANTYYGTCSTSGVTWKARRR